MSAGHTVITGKVDMRRCFPSRKSLCASLILALLLLSGCGHDDDYIDTEPPEYTVAIEPGPYSIAIAIKESEPTTDRRLVVKGGNKVHKIVFKPGRRVVINGLDPDVEYEIEVSGEDMAGNLGLLTLRGRPGGSAPLTETSVVTLYALTVMGYDFPGLYYIRDYHRSLLAYGYNSAIPECVMSKYDDFFLASPTGEELQAAVSELMKYTDSNDVLRYGIAAHGTCGHIFLSGGDARQIVNTFGGDDYGRQDIDIVTCYSKCQLDLVNTPNTIAMGPCWSDETATTRFLELKMARIHGYWEGRIFDAHGVMKSTGEWRGGNPEMTVREFFMDIYGEASGEMLSKAERTHPCLRVTDSHGNVAVYSTYEGKIAGHHRFLGQPAFPVKDDVSGGYQP